jgi:hypothetical protein
MNMKIVRPLALTAAGMLLAVEMIPNEDHKQHVERIPTIAVGSSMPVSNVANATVSYSYDSVASGEPIGLVAPESSLYHLYVSVG